MKSIWELKDWPNFVFDVSELWAEDMQYHQNIGRFRAVVHQIDQGNLQSLKVDILTQEAVSTSLIEGDVLSRDSVQSSIKKQLGLAVPNYASKPAESGIAELMIEVYTKSDQHLDKQTLCLWHSMISNGRRDLETIGDYRKHAEPMQIVSGNLTNMKVFYEAPPSNLLDKEMSRFIDWYNDAFTKRKELPDIVFAGIAHLYFELLHPFEDGNGRIGRALVEKALSQRNGSPTLHSFSKIIELNKKQYYDILKASNHSLELQNWLVYFAKTVIDAQDYTQKQVLFLIKKYQFFSKHESQLNERQIKAALRIFKEGFEGFSGGLSASNYQSITGASPATTTRDLQNLVDLGAFNKTGTLKHTRYSLNIEN